MVEKLLFESIKDEIQGIDHITKQNNPNKDSITSHIDWWRNQIETLNAGTSDTVVIPAVFLEFPQEINWKTDGSGLKEAEISFRVHIVQDQLTEISQTSLATTLVKRMNNLTVVDTIKERIATMPVLNNNAQNQSDYNFVDFKTKYVLDSDEFTRPLHKKTIHSHTDKGYSDTILVFDTNLKDKSKLKKWKRHAANLKAWNKTSSDGNLKLQP